MKVAFLNIYNGIINRGAETYVVELASRLSKYNEVFVIQSGKATGSENYNVREVSVNWNWKNKSGDETLARKFFLDYWSRTILFWTLKTVKIIAGEKIDVVIPINGGWQNIILRIVTWVLKIKMISSGQSGVGWDDRINLYTFPDRFVAISTKALLWSKKINPFVKSIYIPNGVDLIKFNDKKRSHGFRKVLSVGAFTEQKRHELVVEAVARLKRTKLVIVGDGDLKEKINNLAIKKLGKDMFKTLSVKHEDMPSIYRSASLFTLASQVSESFGIVIVEAMASGLPVVVTDDPIRREIVGDAGLFVDPEDTEEYSKAIEKALTLDWGDKPRKQAEKFSWDKVALEYNNLLKSL